LANAIESLGNPAPTPAPVAEEKVEELAEDIEGGATHPSFLARRAQSLGEVSRTVKRPTIRIKPSECTIWPGNARVYGDLSYERCES
jgi:ParB family chromosome partitioning protein